MKILPYIAILFSLWTFAGAQLQAQGPVAAPEITVINGNFVATDGNSVVDFGQSTMGVPVTKTLIIVNSGKAPLTGLAVTTSNLAPTDLSVLEVTQPGATTLAPGESTTFDVQYTPMSYDRSNMRLHIASNDADENPLDILVWGAILQQEIALLRAYPGSGYPPFTNYPPSSGYPSDSYLLESPYATATFPPTAPGASLSQGFVIWNRGTAPLTDITLNLAGSNVGDWAVTSAPASSLAPNTFTGFILTFTPSAIGNRRAQMIIGSSDRDENPTIIPLFGRGFVPAMVVRQGISPVSQSVMTDGESVSYGPARVSLPVDESFTITNDSGAALTGVALSLSGADAADFSIVQNLASPTLAAGAWATVKVRYQPSALGLRQAVLHISRQSGDPDPFDIPLSGTGTQPEIRVETVGGVELPHGGTYDFGTTNILQTTQSIVVRNTGTGALRILTATVAPHSGNFTTEPNPFIAEVPEGGSLTMPLRFNYYADGTFTGVLTIQSDDEDEGTYTLSLTGTGQWPAITVEQPAGVPVVAPQHFGTVAPGAASTRTFSVHNTGALPLVFSAGLTGFFAENFSFLSPTSATVPPGGSTPLTVQFAPTLHGDCTASLVFQTNTGTAGGKGVVTVALTGTGAADTVTFAKEVFRAFHGDTVGVITVRRTNSLKPVVVELEHLANTAQTMPPMEAAQPDVDYTPLAGPATVLNFAIGETEKTVTVPLLAPADGAALNRHLRLRLRTTTPGTVAVGITEATLRILGADSVNPTLLLTAPAEGADIATAPLLAQGVAGDAKGIDRVEVKLNGGDAVAAALDVSGQTPTAVPFSLPLHPVAGANELVVTTYDPRGNSTTLTRLFTFSGTPLPAPAEIVVEEVTTGTALVDGGNWDMGSIVYRGFSTLKLRVRNAGASPLTNIGATLTDPQNFFQAASDLRPGLSLASGESVELTLKSAPFYGQGMSLTAKVQITSNDTDENPFDVTVKGRSVVPQMEVQGPDGSVLVHDQGLQHFGTVSGTRQTYTVRNTGLVDLQNVRVYGTGTHAGEFIIVQDPEAVVHPGESTTFIVQFSPKASGRRDVKLHVDSNAILGSNPFGIVAQGGISTPVLTVFRDENYTVIHGETVPFGTLPVNTSTIETLTIRNDGVGTLSGLALAIDGVAAGDYAIVEAPAASLAQYATTTAKIEFTPKGTGTRSAWLRVTSSNANNSPYSVQLSGTGISPELRVQDANGLELVNQCIVDFGGGTGAPVTKNIVIRNTGSIVLHLQDVVINGPNQAYFSLTSGAVPGTLAPGASTTLAVRFTPDSYGPALAFLVIECDDSDEPSTSIELSSAGAASRLAVEQPAGTPVVADAVHNLGSVVVGTNHQSLTFTIQNPGALPLTVSTQIEGTNEADFIIPAPFQVTIPTLGSTTVTVTFAPQALGTRLATLRIMDVNAPGSPGGVAQLSLSGQGTNVKVALAGTPDAVHGDAKAWVKVTRSETRVPTTVRVQTQAGSPLNVPPFDSATPARDFTALSGDDTVVTFAEGQAEKMVGVPLLNPANRAGINRRLLVTLLPLSGNTIVEGTGELHLGILAEDSSKPVVKFLNTKLVMSTLSPMRVTGTASDAKGIDRVELKLNGGTVILAELGAGAKASVPVSFSGRITPLTTGRNVLVATAYDLRGNSSSATWGFDFTRRRALNYTVVGGAGNTVSMLTPEAVPAKTTHAAEVLPGKVVNLTAKAGAESVFSRWVCTDANLVLTRIGDNISFTMPEADVSLTAEFAASPFALAAGQSNQWHWLLSPDPPGLPGLPGVATEGYLSGAVTKSGSLTGKLLIKGRSVPVTATLFADGPAVFTVAGKKRTSLPFAGGELKIERNLGAGTVVATVTHTGGGTSIGTGRRSPYTTLAKVQPTALLNQGARGSYTVRLTTDAASLPPDKFPQGFGYATMTLTNAGMVTLTGVLADGTALTMSSMLLDNNEAPLFVPLPTPGATTKLGLVTGLLAFAPGVSHDVLGDLRWFRPAAATNKVLLYPQGWPEGLDLEALGGVYSPTMTAQTALSPVMPASPLQLSITGGNLPAPVVKTSFGLIGNKVVKLGMPVDGSYSLAIAAPTGLFSGNFTAAWAGSPMTKPTFRGVILQKPGYNGGYGFFLNNAKNETAPQSGAVRLGQPAAE